MANQKQQHGTHEKDDEDLAAKRSERTAKGAVAKGPPARESPGLRSQGDVGKVAQRDDAVPVKAPDHQAEPSRFDAMGIPGIERLPGYVTSSPDAPTPKDADAEKAATKPPLEAVRAAPTAAGPDAASDGKAPQLTPADLPKAEGEQDALKAREPKLQRVGDAAGTDLVDEAEDEREEADMMTARDQRTANARKWKKESDEVDQMS